MTYPRRWSVISACCLALAVADAAPAAVLYSQNFDVDDSANWAVNKGPATTDEAHDFFFDYSLAGIPSAPNSGGSTRGLKLQANQSAGVFGGVTASPLGRSFTGNYKLTFDWWENFNGPAPAGGSGSTQMATVGVQTSGELAQWPGGMQDSIWFGATGDGNSASDWRAYSPTAPTRYADSAPGIYAAGTQAGSTNSNAPHYASLGAVSPPSAQAALFPQQTGVTVAGSSAFEWHEVEIDVAPSTVAWRVDGLLIATVPRADDSVATGNNIFFGHSDTNATSSIDPNDSALLFTLIDNVQVISGFIFGDFDDDGDVDATDYLTLVANLHTDVSSLTPAQSYPLGDMTRDLQLNGHDFLSFVKAYDDANGVAAFAAMLAAIPEPGSFGLACVCAAWAAAPCRRRMLRRRAD
jgi:hypothetical protein